jgi:sensor domain CHASE-containing protein
VHDAISAERLGIPAAGVITDRFLPTARAMAEFVGLPDYPVTVVAHPISNNTDAEIRAKAEQIVSQAVASLQSPLRRR